MSLTTELTQTFASNFSGFANGGTGGSQWTTTLPHGLRTISGTGELEYYSDPSVGIDPFSTDGTSLDITATAGSTQTGTSYTSGVITTQNSFSQLYGYFEMTATLPAGTGMWPAFWLLPSNLSGTDELDVMEELGSNPDQYTSTLHSPSSGITSATIASADLTAGTHSYGMYWTPTSISFYLDGKMVAVAPTPADMDTPMFMLANLAVAKNVASTTTFPATMEIDSINAYAYNPDVAGPAAPLVANVPSTVSATIGHSTTLAGVSVTDTAIGANDPVSVTLSDKSLGTLSVTAAGATSVTINHTWEIQLTGTLADVNATLQTLSYKNVPTTATPATTDTLTMSASDADGDFDSSRTAITLSNTLPAPAFITLGATPARVVANSNDVFSLTSGQIANPATNSGQVDDIVNFHTAAQTTVTTSDFLALHGFDSTSTLVFDHYANTNGAPNLAMQYYRVDTPTGSSPIFMVQMANAATTHISSADYGFYPT
jgi:beta-glucanase (GH16 family)